MRTVRQRWATGWGRALHTSGSAPAGSSAESALLPEMGQLDPKVAAAPRRKYLSAKYRVVGKLFQQAENGGYLAYRKPAALENPYLDVQARPRVDGATGQIVYQGTPRLSVTRLLTKQWCELRTAYDLYSNMPLFESKAMRIGKRAHRKLENKLHGASDAAATQALERLQLAVPVDPLHRLAADWAGAIDRMCTLFQKGEARELLCHGYISADHGAFVEGPVREDSDVLVSGVIDHLVLTQRGGGSPLSALQPERSLQFPSDMAELVPFLKDLGERRAAEWEVVVGDIKTRKYTQVPSQASVVETSRLQVMYYRRFLEDLGADVDKAYEKLLTNAQRRGLDVDAPLAAGSAISVMEGIPQLGADMLRLVRGDPIGFGPFDSYNRYAAHDTYDFTQHAALLQDQPELQKYAVFFGQWKTPFNLRFLAARMAQLYGCIAPLLSNTLLIEYYMGGECFHVNTFKYDAAELRKHCEDSARFWFGKREIEPIEPTIRNVNAYCKFCDYKDICLWRKEAVLGWKSLGEELRGLP
ncbi:ADR054Cp [Eremothecium gossypii ATCC 10895]|uniref:Exonuclease V, mitochondrial n=1 Tax=Eremothecium gossypii (strain ATCC 10895 / CBS 109.51 / FGSC 9923 / NRRL Y-1056) TaxID=284811 RepID=EXO5_EREGS|nr:ADR054Cp [Eremothecium gossypii ATCC 10895]Q75A64.1 RecName: Full=Exonuclease V, mitochondrial; Short=Exo V; AltName: Full=Defects in morphology protein 1; Flags: Precursor [Eremothecium gossypii ATCC 10895]AAS51974.1 ADR054Cp [Eremothecium gossypii ATCC 10895]